MNFNLQVEAWVKDTSATVNKIAVDSFTESFSRVVKDTPVDTGQAKANWQIGREPVSAPIKAVDPTGKSTLDKIRAFLSQQRPGSWNVVLSNKLPYIVELEYGKSKQAPQGMVRKMVAAFEGIVNKYASRSEK